MADNFNFKQFLVENKLGAYSKATINEVEEDPIDPEDPYGTGPVPYGMFQETDDVIYGMGDDDDYDRKGDAQRTGVPFIPITDPRNPHYRSEPKPSKWSGTYKSRGGNWKQEIANSVKSIYRSTIDNYKFKKDRREAAKETIKKAVNDKVDSYLGKGSLTGDTTKAEVLKMILQPIHDDWAKYAKSKATPNKPEGEA